MLVKVSKTGAILMMAVIMVIIICCSAFILISSVSEQNSRRTFTWISVPITDDLAEWSHDLGFTDVVVRYVSSGEAIMSKNNLEHYNVTFWRLVVGNLHGDPDNSVQGYRNKLLYEIFQSPSGNIYIDDCHAVHDSQGGEAFSNMLEAVRQVQNDGNIILCFYFTNLTPHHDFMYSYDFSDLHIDLYYPPKYYPSHSLNAKSIGMYLWAWAYEQDGVSIGTTWEDITSELIEENFVRAKEDGATRMVTWIGYETEDAEVGMNEASLYNYPMWWDEIAENNVRFIG